MEDIEKYYQRQAEEFVDVLFDNGLFRTDFTREDMRKVEELLAFYIQSHAKTAKKIAEWEVQRKNKL